MPTPEQTTPTPSAQSPAPQPVEAAAPQNPFTDLIQYARSEWRLFLQSLPEAARRLRQLDQVNYELGVACMQSRDLRQAIFRFRFCLLLNRKHHMAMSRLAVCYYETGRIEEAIAWCRKSLALNPDQPELEYMLAAATGAPCRAIPPNVVLNYFDERAAIYNQEYLEYRHYKGPDLMVTALGASTAEIPVPLDLLDLGCGTGLIGAALKPYARRLVGVDISPRMAELATALRTPEGAAVYDEVVIADLRTYLNDQPQPVYDLISAGLAFRYIGDFTPLAAVLPKALKTGGLLCFTVEKHDQPDGYFLHPEGTFRHGEAYIRNAMQQGGFEALSVTEAELFDGCQGLVCLFRLSR